MQIVVRYLRWRHGNTLAVKPPIGWPKWLLWKIESKMHKRYGKELRDKWLKNRTNWLND